MDDDTWRKERMCLTDYANLIQEFRSREYQEVDFTAAEPDRRHLVLRHDVDMCLERAVAMATVEAELGVSASYFLLVNTEMYNVGSRHARNLVGKILRHGHKIGLHFDGSGVPEGAVDALHKEVRLECEILEQHTGCAVTVVTFHRPQQWLIGFPQLVAGRLHGYLPRFFHDIGYCADSGGEFRFHHPLEHPAVLDGRALQLVTHPIWWCASRDEDPLRKLERFFDDRARLLAVELAANCKPYRKSQRLRALTELP